MASPRLGKIAVTASIPGVPMQRRDFLQLTAQWTAVGCTAGVAGCGTIFYPERVHQPHSNDLDWKVVAFDGLGLLLFFVPGVIAFVVDFATGAIYLPPKYTVVTSQKPVANSNSSKDKPTEPNLKRIHVAKGKLTAAKIESVVGEQIGQPISLTEEQVRVSRMTNLNQFVEQQQLHERDQQFGGKAASVFDYLNFG
jgi:hypothetical protein